MKKLTNLLILMILGSSVLFAQMNTSEQIENKDRVIITDVDPNVKVNPHATTFTDGLFEHHFDFPCGDCSGEAGIETNGEYIYTSKWNGDGFFCYEMDGTFLGWFEVIGEAAVRDMAYDGTYFYGAAASTSLFEMDFEGQSGTLISTLTAAVTTRACAYDPEYDGFWGNNWSDPITLYDRTGGILNQFDCGQHSSYYGFARINESGNEWLCGFAQSGGVNSCDIVFIDPETGAETGVVFDAIGYSSSGTGIAGGLAAFDTYSPGFWTLLGIIQNETIFGVGGGIAGTPPELDLRLMGITEPNSGFGLDIENIVIKVKNGGNITQTNFDVRYRVGGCNWIIETVPGTINMGESITYTFYQPYDFSAFGEYYIEAEVLLPGDEFPDNNYGDKTIINGNPSQVHTFSITMYDDYGDGWNGGYVQIFGNGVEFINATLPSGAGPETVEFYVYDSVFLTAVWTSGGWPYECSYTINDCSGEIIFEDGFGGVEPTGGDIGYGIHWSPAIDVGITEIISPESGTNLSNEVVTVNINNFCFTELIDIPIGFAVDNGTIIFDTVPGPISRFSNFEYSFNELADISEYGYHSIEVRTFLPEDQFSHNDCLEKIIENITDTPNQIFKLTPGYQFISSSIIPIEPDMIIVLGEILNENLDFVRNSQGQTLRKIGPVWVNGIGDLITEEGYLVKMLEEDVFTIEGELVAPSIPISLYTAYQFASYLPMIEMDALDAFESIVGENLDFIRNSQGQTIRKIGANWINGIGNCVPKEGYLIKMINNDELIYPAYFCGSEFTDDRDGQIYNTVKIGNQCWMAENLNIGVRIDGIQNMSDNSFIEKYCYDDDSVNCETFGGLYQWNEMMQYNTPAGVQGICPDGWHLPSHFEWTTLERQVCTGENCNTNFPFDYSTSGWRGTNEGFELMLSGTSGFEGLYAGLRSWDEGLFLNKGENAYFWTSTINPYFPEHSWFRKFHNNFSQSYRNGANRNYGLSVRCIKDEISETFEKSISVLNDKNSTLAKNSKNIIQKTYYYEFDGGNPADPVFTIYIDGLEIGDEVAAFDGDILIGSIKINSQNIFDNDLPVFSTINSRKGYVPGNPIILKVWNKAENKEYILKDYTFSNPYGDAWTENVFPNKDGEYSLLHFSTTGISDENVINDISIYPNPTSGIITIGNLAGFQSLTGLEITDITGKIVFQLSINHQQSSIELDLSELKNGVYFINLSGKDLKYVNKIVIQ
jgi:uncharacterized protein (TIGR02145 family)